MEQELKKIRASAREAIGSVRNLDALEQIRVEYVGRKGALTGILRGLKDMSLDVRKKIGEEANHLSREIERMISEKRRALEATLRERVLATERLDVTRPGTHREKSCLHPVTKMLAEIEQIFHSMGFDVADGPEVETDFYNFEALNIPVGHPARDMWDTFWLKPIPDKKGTDPLLLRTHTSPVQVRYMKKHNPPIRIIVPGRTYRYEPTDASHDFQFSQLEGLMVDKNISVANMKAILQEFFSRLFKKHIEIRLRPSYFPFVEPGFEIDISCIICNGKGCSMCKQTGWLELAGAGMVHPHVFKAAGYNPKEVKGFAFGFGLSRLVLMKYKIPDIRLFNSGDLRFLKQF